MSFLETRLSLPVAGSTATTPAQQLEASDTRIRPAASTTIPSGAWKYWVEALTAIALDESLVSLPVTGSTAITAPQPLGPLHGVVPTLSGSVTRIVPVWSTVIPCTYLKYWLDALTAIPF